MPINACSINTYSVDAICSTKRAKYIDMFWTSTPPVVVHGGGGGFAGHALSFNTDTEYKVKPAEVELPYISITVSFNGETVTTVFENKPWEIKPLISINKLYSEFSEIDVKLTALSIGKNESDN